jgi:hypothetical protein
VSTDVSRWMTLMIADALGGLVQLYDRNGHGHAQGGHGSGAGVSANVTLEATRRTC